MSMSRGDVERIIDRSLPPMAAALGLDRWRFERHVERISNEPSAYQRDCAEACVDAMYETAVFRFDASELRDESDVLASLRHELLHVVHGSFGLYGRAACEHVADDRAQAALGILEDHAAEQTVLALERLLDGLGLTPEVLIKLGRGGKHTIRDVADVTEEEG